MSEYEPAIRFLFEELSAGEKVEFIGSQLCLMSSSVCVAALGFMSSSQLKDVCAMLAAHEAAKGDG